MKFRFHRGGLAESLATTVEIGDSYQDLKQLLANHFSDPPWKSTLLAQLKLESLSISSYPDSRCWPNQHIVTFGRGNGVLGYIDGPIEQFYPTLAERYRIMNLLALTQPETINTKLPAEFQPLHLLWMIEEMCYLPEKDQSLTKKHRWLGFIQTACIAHGWTTVQVERDFTRPILNGA